VLVIGGGIWYLAGSSLRAGGGGSGHPEGSDFAHYAGPVMPLNVSGDTEGIAANRSIHFDFAADKTGQNNLQVTDRYNLINNSSMGKTIQIFYPFISSMMDSGKLAPAMTVNGNNLGTKLLMGDYTGGFTGASGGSDDTTFNLAHIKSWQGYKSLLEDGRYLERAQEEKNLTDQSVTVYTFDNVKYPKEYEAATLAIDFDLPEGSKVITYGMNGASFENGSSHHRYSYFIQNNTGQKIIILGKPPVKYTVQGYENGACEKKADSITAEVKTETMMLSEVIKKCMEQYNMAQYGAEGNISSLVTKELAYGAVVSMLQYTALGSSPKDRYDWMRLDDLIGESYTMERVMYLTAQVTIPAGQSIELQSRFIKGASYDFACAGPKENKGVTGYDMMTKLGSSLKFTEQKASISLPQNYEIIRQNFGFDAAKGITEVGLDLAQERYYMEIKENAAAGR
jgi:hypothetical protein